MSCIRTGLEPMNGYEFFVPHSFLGEKEIEVSLINWMKCEAYMI